MARGKKENRVKISVVIIIMLLLMGGSAAGAYIETGMDEAERTGAVGYLNSVLNHGGDSTGGTAVFKEAVKSNGLMLAVMGVGCMSVVLFPLAPAVLFYKGMAVGFTSGLIMEGSPGTGIPQCCAALLLQNVIFMSMLGVYCYFTICTAMSVIKCRNRRFRARIYGDNLKLLVLVTGAAGILLCLGAAAEAFINPVLSGII